MALLANKDMVMVRRSAASFQYVQRPTAQIQKALILDLTSPKLESAFLKVDLCPCKAGNLGISRARI